MELYEHQKRAVEFFKDKCEIALFFEMGCGKTCTSLSIAIGKYKAGLITNVLVVAPNEVHRQWYMDLKDQESILYHALNDSGVEADVQIIGGRYGQKALHDYIPGKLNVLCCNIDTFSTPHKWEPVVEWATINKTALIVDEATVIKNPTSKRSQRMLYEFNNVVKSGKTIKSSSKLPNTQVRMVLTGTPVTNGPIDLWAIMEFIKPNYFGRNYYSFMNYYGMHTRLNVQDRVVQVLLTEKTWRGIKDCSDYMEALALFGCSEDTYLTIKSQDHFLGPYKHADELKKLLEPNAIFCKLTDCVDMPAKNYVLKKIPLSQAQEACYNNMKHDLLAQFADHITTATNKMVVTLRLQQISSGFIMGHEEIIDEDAPMWSDEYDVGPDEIVWLDDCNPRMAQLLRDVDEMARPCIIFTRFSAEAAKIYELLKDKYSVCLMTGWKTIGDIEKFKTGEYDIMVANIAKMSRGYNLQIAHNTIYYSNTFSMEHRAQSEFRTFRIGQTHPCTYVDYESCAVDKLVNDSIKLKKNMLEYIREKDVSKLV